MARSFDAPEYAAIAAAADHVRRAPPRNLSGIAEADATGEVAGLYQHFRDRFGRSDVPGILQCFATHPPLLRHMMNLSEDLIFSEGHLGRRLKEMIATLVSARNECPYCADSHGFFLRMHGGSAEVLQAMGAGDFHDDALDAKERTLLAFAVKVNEQSHAVAPADIDGLRQAGWSDAQIAEAIHVTALFATYNRVANAFGLESQELLTMVASREHRRGPETESGEHREHI